MLLGPVAAIIRAVINANPDCDPSTYLVAFSMADRAGLDHEKAHEIAERAVEGDPDLLHWEG